MGELIRRYIPSWIEYDMCYLYCTPACVVSISVKSTENADFVKKKKNLCCTYSVQKTNNFHHSETLNHAQSILLSSAFKIKTLPPENLKDVLLQILLPVDRFGQDSSFLMFLVFVPS